MEKIIAIMGTESMATLTKKHNCTEMDIVNSVVNGNEKILKQLKQLIEAACEIL